MKITRLEKKKRLYLMELDASETSYITEDTIVHFMLSQGKEITDTERENILEFAQFSYGKNLALYYLSFKTRTQQEVTAYLTKHEMNPEIIKKVIENLKKDKWIDDRGYVISILTANQLSGDKGPYLLIQKLAQKGLSKTLVQEILEDFDLSEVARRTAQKLLGKYQGKFPKKALQDKIIQTLSNKGFSYNQAKSAYDQLEIDVDEDTTQDLLEKEFDRQYRKYSQKYEGYELKQRLTRALARKGYDFSDISSALRDYL